MIRVLFVCLGNICRSPTADGVFQGHVKSAGLEGAIHVDSAGTGDWHIGHPPDKRAAAKAKERGYDLSKLRARQVKSSDFEQFDFILAMDKQNLADLSRQCPTQYQTKISLFLDFADGVSEQEVPDPYYGGEQGFNHVFDLVEAGSEGLLKHLQQQLSN